MSYFRGPFPGAAEVNARAHRAAPGFYAQRRSKPSAALAWLRAFGAR
ncbi:MAG: hypothetical protein QOF76_56 [Solirubrobacteraceae bacterium]|nr:hypothetical protein [Solirubrobacteraceae bacterium]